MYEPNPNILDADTGEQITATTQPHPSSRRPCVLLKLSSSSLSAVANCHTSKC